MTKRQFAWTIYISQYIGNSKISERQNWKLNSVLKNESSESFEQSADPFESQYSIVTIGNRIVAWNESGHGCLPVYIVH